MTAEQSRAAAQNRQQNLAVLPGDPVRTLFEERPSCTADDIGHLQRGGRFMPCRFALPVR